MGCNSAQQLTPRPTSWRAAEFRRQANLAANGGKERKDLYTDNWDGSEYKARGSAAAAADAAADAAAAACAGLPGAGQRLVSVSEDSSTGAQVQRAMHDARLPLATPQGSRWNILTVLALLFLAVPVAGLGFAYWSYGTLWG